MTQKQKGGNRQKDKLVSCVSLPQLVRTCARYHQEQKKSEERSKKEREINLRHIASTIAREVEFFWSNIEQVCLFILMYKGFRTYKDAKYLF